MILKRLISQILFVCAFLCKAQTNNFLVSGNDKVNFIFNPYSTIIETNSFSNSGIYPFNSICNSKGQLQILLTTDQYNQNDLIDWTGRKIPNSRTKVNTYENYLLSFPNNNFRLIYTLDSNSSTDKQNTLGNILRKTDGVYLNQIQYSGSQYVMNSKDIQILNKNILNFSTCRKNDSTYLAVLNTPEKLYSILIYWNKTIVVDSIQIERFACLPDSLKNNPLISTKFNTFIYLSHDGTKLLLNEQSSAFFAEYTGNIYTSNKFGAGCSTIKNYTLDPFTNKFTSSYMVDGSYLTYKVSEGLVNPNLIFSPNSQIIYAIKSSDSINLISNKTEIWQYNLNDISPGLTKRLVYSLVVPKKKNDTILFITNLPKLSPTGHYLFFTTEISKQPDKLTIYSNLCSSTNNISPNCNLSLKNQSFSIEKYGTNYISFSNKQIYDFVRIKYNIKKTKDCSAEIKFINNSDTSGGLHTFKYIIKKPNQLFDTIIGFDPLYKISKNGLYPFKVIGYGENGYSEAFEDTLVINIIQAPKILKLNYPASICRYKPFKVSADIEANENDSSKYSWRYYIDKSDALYHKQIIHAFEDTGIFPLILIFSNSYCQDTFNGTPIRVINAPQPGFILQIKGGCSPFIGQFKDTITKNVKSKDYWFSDNGIWENIPVNQVNFTHTFTKKGNYKVIQRLTGFSGCITQEDTLELIVSAGIKANDTLNIINSTIENQSAKIWWNKHEAATAYQLLKDGLPYIKLKDTFFIEKAPYLKDAIFTVIAMDSCGNTSNIGRYGKPMFLQGNIVGHNQASIIYFSTYGQWKSNDIKYNVQKKINGIWSDISVQNDNSNFKDDLFALSKELQSCYRIVAIENTNSSMISISNEVCIPYIPVIFIPSAFSPNNDAINDTFDINCFGIASYKITVYNRWGNEVFRGNNKQGWDGGNSPEGIYLIRIEYTTNLGIKMNQQTTITLLK
ncbi:MAG: gliding motility-associated C-terminal domain-containing protein [Bacteroidota bacterium]